MVKLILLMLVLLVSGMDDFKLIKIIPVKTDLMLTDNLQNVYSINNSLIIKYDKNGDELSQYSNSYLGDISYADVTDPMRILLFYKDFNQILLLDNNLSEISDPVNLDDLDIRQAGIVCSSNHGGFWVYDLQSTCLIFINSSLEKEITGFEISSLISQSETPNFLIEKNDFVYLNFPGNGIMVFDRFGAFYKIIKITGLSTFQIMEKNIMFHENNSLYCYDTDRLSSTTIILPDTMGVIDSRLEQDRLYLHKPENIRIYNLPADNK